ncbi:MAG: transporter substrate-binding domain-containing protein [Pirellulaceae bacterium]
MTVLSVVSIACNAAQEDEPNATDIGSIGKLRVATKHIPPFAIKESDGNWSGISIELWKHLAHELGVEYELTEHTLEQMLAGLENGEFDVALGAISVTADRQDHLEFCHPHFSTGLAIAVSSKNHRSPWVIFRRIVSSGLFILVFSMIGVVAVCGLLFWLFERRRNENMFGGKRRQGIGMGIWWSTTLLLGHKGITPVSTLGRILATCAMLCSIIVLSIFTGIITSVLTVQQLDTGILDVTDLHRARVVTVQASTSEDYLRNRRIAFRSYPDANGAIQAVEKDEADAVVYDAALLKYLATEKFANRINVLPVTFNVQEYAIALSPNNQLRKPLNSELLRYRESDAWEDLVYRYLGE